MIRKLGKRIASAWVNLPLRGKGLVVVLILPATILLAVAASIFLGSTKQPERTAVVVGATLKTRAQIGQARSLILMAETALRSYEITGQQRFLDEYRNAGASLAQALGQLEQLVRNKDVQSRRIQSIRSRLQETEEVMAAILRRVREERGTPETMAALFDEDRAARGRLESEFAKLETDEDRLLGEWGADQTQRAIHTFIAIVATILLGLIASILAIILFATGIVRRVERLQKSSAELVEGQAFHLGSVSDDEIGRLEVTLNNTSKLLQQRDRRLAESHEAYQKQNAVLQSILDRMSEGVIVFDENGRILVFNPAAENIMGMPPIEGPPSAVVDRYGFYLPDMVTPYPTTELPLTRAMRGEAVDSAHIFVRNAQRVEGVWITTSARPLRTEDSACGAILVIRDVTVARRAEEALYQAKDQAEAANRAKSEFLSRMSHELRTPLNAILGFAQVLEMDSLKTDQLQSLEQILKGGRHLLTLINEVLDIARIEAGHLTLSPEPILVSEALDEALDLVAPLALHRGISVSRQVAETWKQHIQADRQRLKQVILNLLSNAIKYNRDGGSVTVSCVAKAGDRLRMEIKDTGLGIPASKMSLLFSPFERLGAEDTSVEGSGVGLALSKKLVEAMSGLIGAESEFGHGSVFWVEFPLIEGQMQRYERCLDPEPPVIAEPCQRPMTVLYVEDNLSNSLLMETVFATRPGIKLLTAMQGRMGLDLAREHVPDLILLDLHLPDMHGDEVLRQLRADRRTKDIPVAIVSADATPGQIERLLAAGAQSYLTKPLDIKNLLAFVDETSAQVQAARTDRDPGSLHDGRFESTWAR